MVVLEFLISILFVFTESRLVLEPATPERGVRVVILSQGVPLMSGISRPVALVRVVPRRVVPERPRSASLLVGSSIGC